MSPERSPLESARAFVWTVLFIAIALAFVVWIISEIWPWLLLLGGVIAAVSLLVAWLRWRRGRW